MTIKNKYANRSKISEKKFGQILRLFCLDLDALQIAGVTGLNCNAVNRYLNSMEGKAIAASLT